MSDSESDSEGVGAARKRKGNEGGEAVSRIITHHDNSQYVLAVIKVLSMSKASML